jgi:ribosomal protein S27E
MDSTRGKDGLSRPTELPPVDMSKAKIDLDFDAAGQGRLKIKCPACRRTTTVQARDARPGKRVPCSCGRFTAVLEGDDLRDVEKAMDKLMRVFKDFGK